MAKWFQLDYLNQYGVERSHTFSGNRDTLQLVLNHWNIDVTHVNAFYINDEPVDIERYLGVKDQ